MGAPLLNVKYVPYTSLPRNRIMIDEEISFDYLTRLLYHASRMTKEYFMVVQITVSPNEWPSRIN